MNVYRYASIFAKTALFDAELASPEVVIEPFETIVDAAIKKIRKFVDPNYFKGIRKIKITPGPNYGHVRSGPDQDPTIVNINANRVKQELKDVPEEEIVNIIASILGHEVGHVRSFDEQQGFVGGETPADAEEERVLSLLRDSDSQNMME